VSGLLESLLTGFVCGVAGALAYRWATRRGSLVIAAFAISLCCSGIANAQALKTCLVNIHPEWNDGLHGIKAFSVTVQSNGLWRGECFSGYPVQAENPLGDTIIVAGVTTSRLRGTEANFGCLAVFDTDIEPEVLVLESEVVTSEDGTVPAVVTAEVFECFDMVEHDSNRNGSHDVADPLCSILVLVGLPCR